MRCQDKRDAEAERGVEAELVKDARSLGLTRSTVATTGLV